MCKKTKSWLMIAAFLVVIGLIIFASVMAVYRWDFTRLSTIKYETSTYEASEAFRNISINTDTDDIIFVTAEDGKCKVVCYEAENAKHSVDIQDDILTINEINKKKWYHSIGILMETPKITVYLPDAKYDVLTIKASTGDIEIPKDFRFESIDISTSTGDVKNDASASGEIQIKTSTGNICVENIFADALELSSTTGGITVSKVTCEGDVKSKVSTGKTNMTDIQCKNVTSNGTTGDIFLKNVIALEQFSIKRSTGKVKFDACDAAEISVETDTGDVTGTLLSEKIFFVETAMGNIDVPQNITGGKCEIKTDTGDIELDIQ